MKHYKSFLMLLASSLLMTSIAYANPLNRHDMLPNNIPESIVFNLTQPGGNSAEIFFQNSSLPAKFLCYFTSDGNQQFKNITASITSTNSKVEFMPGVDTTMTPGKTDVKMFTVSSLQHTGTGSIVIALEGDIPANKGKTITMICTMHK